MNKQHNRPAMWINKPSQELITESNSNLCHPYSCCLVCSSVTYGVQCVAPLWICLLLMCYLVISFYYFLNIHRVSHSYAPPPPNGPTITFERLRVVKYSLAAYPTCSSDNLELGPLKSHRQEPPQLCKTNSNEIKLFHLNINWLLNKMVRFAISSATIIYLM